jgi:hypothetical protein
MPPRDAVSQLPEELRAQIDSRLIKGGFSGYEELAAWLQEQGFAISKSALHRYGQKFEDRVQALKMATGQAKALVESSPDDEGAVGEALMRLVQEKLFAILLEFEVTDPSKLNLGAIAKAIASLGRTSIAQKKYATEVKERAQAAAASVEKLVKKGGLSAETVRDIRREILGIAK